MASRCSPWRVCQSLLATRPRQRPSLPRPAQQLFTPIAAPRRITDSTDHKSEDGKPPQSKYLPGHPYYEPPPPELITEGSFEGFYKVDATEVFAPNFLNARAVKQLEQVAAGEQLEEEESGLKFGVPPKVSTRSDHLQDRYSPLITQVTKLIMQDGQLSKAQRHVSMILNFLRTSSPPKVSPLRPLLPGSPPSHVLPLDPVLYLTLAIDSVAPLMRIRNLKGMAGGGNSLEVPEPLPARSRRRIAILWILDQVKKSQNRGSGRTMFAHRFAQEIVAVMEGRSSVWDRRQNIHKLATAARANLSHPAVAPKRRTAS